MPFLILLSVFSFTALVLRADNPIVATGAMTDPFAVVYGERVYIYAKHDFAPDTRWFIMKDWWVWSSTDLDHWRQVGTLHHEQTYLKKPFDECWGTSAATRNGKYYWYFSAGPTEIGVVEADVPAGPWHDPLGKPLIPKGLVPPRNAIPPS